MLHSGAQYTIHDTNTVSISPFLRPTQSRSTDYPKERTLLTAPAQTANPVLPHFSLDLPVRFAETDAMGVVHHSAYVIWLEAARVGWMDALGTPYAAFAAAGHHFAVTAVHLNYRQSARFGDVVRIEIRLTLLRSRQVAFAYAVRRAADGLLLATATTEHVCVDLQGRVATIPAAVLERLRPALDPAD